MLYLCAGIIGYMLGAFTIIMLTRHRNTQIQASSGDNAVQTQVINYESKTESDKHNA